MYEEGVLLKLGILVLLGGIAVGMEPRNEPKTYTPQAVEKLTTYPSAPISELIPVDQPVAAPTAAKMITGDLRKKLERQMRAIAADFGVNLTNPVEWSGHPSPHGNHRSKNGAFLSVDFDEGNKVTHFYLTGRELPHHGTKMVTPILFEGYARKCYRKVFGILPVGAVKLKWDGFGLKGGGSGEAADWSVSIDGVPMMKVGSVATQRDGLGEWSLSCRKGPSADEVEALTKILKTQPTHITEEEAVAAAWKNWKEVRQAPYTGTDFTIWCRLREVSQAEKEPWGVYSHSNTERRAWKNKTQESSQLDPVFFEVGINQALFRIDVLVDRKTGQVLRMNQGRMSW